MRLAGIPALAAGMMAMLTVAADAANIYGAIAYSPNTGIHGYSYNYPSRGDAERRALRNCRAQASDCKVVVHFHRACGALAVGRGNGWGAAWAAQRRQAEGIALGNCRQFTTGCTVVRWVCSG